jgi:hypothetical protein
MSVSARIGQGWTYAHLLQTRKKVIIVAVVLTTVAQDLVAGTTIFEDFVFFKVRLDYSICFVKMSMQTC